MKAASLDEYEWPTGNFWKDKQDHFEKAGRAL